ncbi:MAG: hypothetical protein ABSE86_08920 [Bryobacteraceae bacterium]|jgi:hypothetical protein
MSFNELSHRAAAAAVLMIAWIVVMGYVPPKYPFPYIFHHDVASPILALEISRDADDIEAVLHRADPLAKQAASFERVSNQLDLIFIPLYAFFFWSLARVFAERTRLLTLFILGTALFDYAEDWQIFRALDGENPAIFIPSLVKWGLLGVVLLGTGIILLRSRSPVYSLATKRLLAIAYFISGLLLLIAVAFGTRIGYSLIALAIQLLAFVVVVHVIGFLGHYLAIPGITQKYVENFCEERKKIGKESLIAVEPSPRE